MKFPIFLCAALAVVLVTSVPVDAGPKPITADEVRERIEESLARGDRRLADRWRRVLGAIMGLNNAFDVNKTRWIAQMEKAVARYENGEITRDEVNKLFRELRASFSSMTLAEAREIADSKRGKPGHKTWVRVRKAIKAATIKDAFVEAFDFPCFQSGSGCLHAYNDTTPKDVPEWLGHYGAWLEVNDQGHAVGDVQAWAHLPPGATALSDTTVAAMSSATFTGLADGVSILNGHMGEFVADLNLKWTARNGDVAGNMTGTVSNFRGDAVNQNWRVELAASGRTTGSGGDPGTFGTYGGAHVWDWQAYGDEGACRCNGEHPAGVVGTFRANFTDGAAVGAFDAHNAR